MPRTLAYVSLRCTGLRSITAVTRRLDQLSGAGCERRFRKRMERKCGSARNVEKSVYV